jgi:hypothetical protein
MSAFMPAWLSWTLYAYHCGTVDARRGAAMVAAVWFGFGFLLGKLI